MPRKKGERDLAPNGEKSKKGALVRQPAPQCERAKKRRASEGGETPSPKIRGEGDWWPERILEKSEEAVQRQSFAGRKRKDGKPDGGDRM